MKFIVHDNPAMRSRSNYVARVDLTPFGFADHAEQLWLRQLDNETCEVCCIPFRVYGIALQDSVKLSRDGANVTEFLRPSGRRALRFFMPPNVLDSARASDGLRRVAGEIDSMQLLYEWSGDRHVAIDVPPGVNVDHLIDLIEQEEREAGALWEWSDVMPFST